MDFFAPNTNPLLEYHLNPGLNFSMLAPSLIILAILLGYAAYTDFFKGWIIPDGTNITILIIGLVTSPFIYENPWNHFKISLIVAVIVFVFSIFLFAPGDTKLYTALGFSFGAGLIPLMIFSWVLFLTYGIFYLAKKYYHLYKNKKENKKTENELTQAPLGPAIAMSFPYTLYVAGIKAEYALALFGIQIIVLLSCWLQKQWRPEKGWFSEEKIKEEERKLALGEIEHSYWKHGPKDNKRMKEILAEIAEEEKEKRKQEEEKNIIKNQQQKIIELETKIKEQEKILNTKNKFLKFINPKS